jgi:serine/threonine protein kinase
MELADGSLLDRFRETQAGGLPGIPFDELLEYMIDVARGLDYLNGHRHDLGDGRRVGIQHRDLKPENILLSGGAVKVADFGLTRLLENSMTGHTGSWTPHYAAPEFFDARTSDHSDQYSLAVSYCLLRGGRLPFRGNQAQLMAAHIFSQPDLTMLPEGERPILARALAKDAKDRWPNCKTFVEQISKTRRTGHPSNPDFEVPPTINPEDVARYSPPVARTIDVPTPFEEFDDHEWDEASVGKDVRTIDSRIADMNERIGVLADVFLSATKIDPGERVSVRFNHPTTGKELKVVSIDMTRMGTDPVYYLRLTNLRVGIEWWSENHPVFLRVYTNELVLNKADAIQLARTSDGLKADEAIGFLVKGGFKPLIPIGTPIPILRSKRLRTSKDNQKSIKIEVIATRSGGERRPLASFSSREILPAPAGIAWVDCSVRVDQDGRFTMIVRDPLSNRAQFAVLG